MESEIAQAGGRIDTFGAAAWAWTVEFLPRLAAAVLILIAGYLVASWLARLIRAGMKRASHLDSTLEPAAAMAARYAVLIVATVAALGQLGVQTTSLLAVLGAAGLAIGLALQGTLSNVAAGIMLLYLRPFRSGDTIETPQVTGTVREIGLFATQMETPDGLFYFVPNASLWNVPLKNHTRNARRMVSAQASIGYAADFAEVRRLLLELASGDRRILPDPLPVVSIEGYTDQRVIVALRAWTSTADFAVVQRELTEAAKSRLQSAGFKPPGA
jgi:small conductance mechanosensitive channel